MRELEIVEQLVLGVDPAGRRDPLGHPQGPGAGQGARAVLRAAQARRQTTRRGPALRA
ncbi:hypothetical protein JOS77_02800 [Chromobacterium haemolyticum]|nr:hypothetical protein JOS77_02800 [Chromobacterium haemolyticum]